MRFSKTFGSAFLLLAAGVAEAASSWSFDQGSLAVAKKGSGGVKEKINPKTPLTTPISLGVSDTIKISLTAKDNGKAKRPHQAFVVLREVDSGLEAPFPLTLKENGQGTVQIPQKEIPVQLLHSRKPLEASVVIASFGSAQGLDTRVFSVDIASDPSTPTPQYEKPVRYGKKPEIHHIFRADPKNPPKAISFFFAAAVLATLPALFIGWLFLGANVSHLPQALGRAPLSHAAFFGSIIGMEAVFFLYYTTWNLFQVLPAIAVVGAVAIVSGPKALGEVQIRRLAGAR